MHCGSSSTRLCPTALANLAKVTLGRLGEPLEGERITISVEVQDFEEDLDLLVQLTDFRLDDDADTARLTYEFRPLAGLDEFLRQMMTMSSFATAANRKRSSSDTNCVAVSHWTFCLLCVTPKAIWPPGVVLHYGPCSNEHSPPCPSKVCEMFEIP
jgi:hypothetical protein